MPSSLQSELRLTATGNYPYPMPPDLLDALRESIIQHMTAYGVTDVQVKGEHFLAATAGVVHRLGCWSIVGNCDCGAESALAKARGETDAG